MAPTQKSSTGNIDWQALVLALLISIVCVGGPAAVIVAERVDGDISTQSFTPSVPPQKTFGTASNLAAALNSEVVVDNTQGAAGIAFFLTVPTGATVVFESSFDGVYVQSTLRRTANNSYVTSTNATGTYLGSIAGARSFRVRVSVAGSAAGSVIGTTSPYVNTLEGIENGPPSDFETNIAEGKIAGYSLVNKNGRNPDIDTGTLPEDIWDGGGAYTGFPVTAVETVTLTSSSTNDTAAGTGARTVTLTGLDTNYVLQTETVTLNGTTGAATTNTFRRVHTAFVATAGSGGVNAGTITATHTTTTANVFFAIQPGTNQMQVSAFTIPAGKTGYLRQFSGAVRSGTGTGAVDTVLYIRDFNGVFRHRRPSGFSGDPSMVEIYGGLVLPEKTDIIIRATAANASNLDVAGGYDLILVDN